MDPDGSALLLCCHLFAQFPNVFQIQSGLEDVIVAEHGCLPGIRPPQNKDRHFDPGGAQFHGFLQRGHSKRVRSRLFQCSSAFNGSVTVRISLDNTHDLRSAGEFLCHVQIVAQCAAADLGPCPYFGKLIHVFLLIHFIE